RFVSAGPIITALRSRKTPAEIERIQTAIATTFDIYDRAFEAIAVGKQEREIGQVMHDQVDALGLETSWERAACPAVNSGPDTPIGHAGPTEIRIEPGAVSSRDFGVKQNENVLRRRRVTYVLLADTGARAGAAEQLRRRGDGDQAQWRR
ncbi:MAG: hypothetical protein IPM07_25970, partial [Anaerolineales bacterium]|nr:hypothetical protein [Anaerolineales bacterium]